MPEDMPKYQLLDLFSGIRLGGFSLGLERTGGFETVAFCEIDPFCQRVLNKHWPEVPCYDDIRTLTADTLRRDGIAVDAICGGFPCQDISVAGKGDGIEGARSGLWTEFARLIGELRPRVVFVENVANLLSGPSTNPGAWFGRVLGDLAALGYDAWWDCIPASAVGAPHQRDRVWIVANTAPLFGPSFIRCEPNGDHEGTGKMADTKLERLEGQQQTRPETRSANRPSDGCDPGWWSAEPDVGRVADGVPKRVDRLKALGNAVVPQIPEMIGRAWLATHPHD